MNNSILIGKLIYERLSSSPELKKYIANKIFPLIAEQETTFPYVAFSKDSITPSYTKGGNFEDTVSVQIIVASTDYLESLNIANIVRKIFECRLYSCDELQITESRLSSVSEAYDDNANAFIQRLIFNFKIS